MKHKNFVKWLGFLGFFGFFGFDYFITRNPMDLFQFCYFSFFAYFIIAKMSKDMPDERFIENSKRAQITSSIIPAIALFVIGFCSSAFTFITKDMMIAACAVCFALTIIAYAILFYYYDNN